MAIYISLAFGMRSSSGLPFKEYLHLRHYNSKAWKESHNSSQCTSSPEENPEVTFQIKMGQNSASTEILGRALIVKWSGSFSRIYRTQICAVGSRQFLKQHIINFFLSILSKHHNRPHLARPYYIHLIYSRWGNGGSLDIRRGFYTGAYTQNKL